MIDHDKGCRGCATAKYMAERGDGCVYSDLGHCARCGPTYDSSSYLHTVEGERYCARCADIMARARNERMYLAAMYGIGVS